MRKRSNKGKKAMSEQAPERAIVRAVDFGDLQDTHDQAKEKLDRATDLLRKSWDAYGGSKKAFDTAREQLVAASRSLFSF